MLREECCIPLNWNVELCRAEIMHYLGLPRYDLDTEYYEGFCLEQNKGFVVAKSWTAEVVAGLPYVASQLQALGLLDQVGHCQIFVCRPRHIGLWHLDGVDRHASINFPLFNTEHGQVDWTAADIECIKEANEYTTHSVPVDRDAFHRVEHSSVLTGVQLLKTDIWHRLDNADNTLHRVVFSIRFKTNPLYETLRPIFESQV